MEFLFFQLEGNRAETVGQVNMMAPRRAENCITVRTVRREGVIHK